MVGNVVISEVDVLLYVVLTKAEKHVSYWCHRMHNVINEVPQAKTEVVITEFNCKYILSLILTCSAVQCNTITATYGPRFPYITTVMGSV